MAELRNLSSRIVVYIVAFTWSIFVVLSMLRSLFKYGFEKFFYVKHRKIAPDLYSNPKFGKHKYIQLTKVRLHYVCNGPEGAPLMLLLHGFPECWYSWRNQLTAFSDQYKVVAIDMRGYGDSSKPKSQQDYTLDELVMDVRDVVKALGYSSCVLIGHDWGGAVAGATAQKYPHLVSHLVICNMAHLRAFKEHLATSNVQKFRSWYMMFFQMPWLPELGMRIFDMRNVEQTLRGPKMGAKQGITAEDMEVYKFSFYRPGSFSGPINYYRALYQYKLPDYVNERITVPALIIWGTADAALERQLAVKSADYMDHVQLRFIEGVSHWVQQEDPETVNRFILEFLCSEEDR